MILVADTSPINYLILIGQIILLPRIFKKIVIPAIVFQELSDSSAPLIVQDWITNPPDWLEIQYAEETSDVLLDSLDPGERAAIF